MAEISSESQFFSGNIANMIPEGPLNKMIPLTEDQVVVVVVVVGGGGGGGWWWWGGGGGGGSRGTPVSSWTSGRTGRQVHQKQRCSSKATVYGVPRDQQLVLM